MAVTSVASSASSVKLLAAATRRRSGVIITNDDANRLYVLLDSATASATNYSFSLAQNENACLPPYTGEINGIWSAAGTGAAKITTLHD